MTTYTIAPERATLHGSFSRALPPVLEIAPGDTVHYRTLDAGWNLTLPETDDWSQKFVPRDPVRDAGHALCGPIAIRGAEPGMTLAVHIDAIVPGAWGWTLGGGWPTRINERLGIAAMRGYRHRWALDAATLTGRDQDGFTVALHPFMGVMGMPPDAPGWHSTSPPRITGGNIDCKELVAGSTLYLPLAVPLGLFSTGDGHAAQGDGEVSQLAIECPMERVSLTFDLLPDLHLTTPRANTPAGWITLGFHEDLHEAAMIALEAMVDLLGEQFDIARPAAIGLASVAVDLHVTQLVNGGVLGVHAILSHGAIRREL